MGISATYRSNQMNHRFLASLGLTALTIGLAVALVAPLPVAGQPQNSATQTALGAKPTTRAKPWTLSKTPDGQPDLQGYWTNNSYTPLQRAQGVTKEFYTEQELVVAEKKAAASEGEQIDSTPGTLEDVHFDFTQFGLDKHQTGLTHNLRTSVIIDPPNGKIPPMTDEGKKRTADRAAQRPRPANQYDQVQNLTIGERCIYAKAGPPMLSPAYNATYEIVQSPGYVTIVIEELHETRVIPLDGRPHPPETVRSWLGYSRGRWEGDALVVETTNFNDQVAFQGASEDMKVVERFTRTNVGTIRYEFTVDDPHTWTQPWKGEMPFVKINGPIFENACHEGNYDAANYLTEARAEERKAAEAVEKKGSNK
jgi:hypothetical protein